MSEIDTSPEALRNLVIRLNNASRWRGDVLDEAAATLDALAAEKERAMLAPAGDLVSVLVSTARPLVMPAGWADKELTAAFETALAIIRMAGKEVVDAAPAGDLVEIACRAFVVALGDPGYADPDKWHGWAEAMTAALAAIQAAGREIVDAGTVERLTRELDGMRQSYSRLQLVSDKNFGRANAAERERDEARQQRSRADAEMARQMIRAHNAEVEREHVRSQKNERITALEAEAARLRELVEDVRDCLDALLTGDEDPDEILSDILDRARAALATKEPGHGVS
jgi:hypothetical protein